jgi:hypothetical protein
MKMVIIAQKLPFCDLKNTMISLESFSLAAEGHRKRGKFSVDLSYSLVLLCIQPFDTIFFPLYFNKIPRNRMTFFSMDEITIMTISTHPQNA